MIKKQQLDAQGRPQTNRNPDRPTYRTKKNLTKRQMDAMEQSYINGQVIKKQMVENRRKRKEMEEQITKQSKIQQEKKRYSNKKMG